MPKIVDIQERERAVSEAAWRVMARDGVTALSVRNVAAEAGMSPSSMRHFFPTQASVRVRAVALLLDRLVQRVAEAESGHDGPQRALAILLELLPLDRERRTEMEVTLAFGALAMTDSALRETHQQIFDTVRTVCARAVRSLGADDSEVPGTHALIDGIALHLVQQQPGAETGWVLDAVQRWIERLPRAAASTAS
ncbi:MAG: TetR family transcriptional regulator C-terminal domain-containing protein [Glaciihabitans sp.]